MNFFKKYPNAKPRAEGGEEYEGCMVLAQISKDIDVVDEYRGCRKCGEPTLWIEINYGAYVCSEECLQELDAEFRDALFGELDT